MRQNTILLSLILLFSGIIIGTEYTADLCTNPANASAESTYEDNTPDKAFDDDLSESSRWEPYDEGVPQWIEYDFGSNKTIQRYTLYCAVTAYTPTEWKLQGSDNGFDADINWTDIHHLTGQSIVQLTRYTYDCPNNTAYRYYRIDFLSAQPAGGYVIIREIEMMEVTSATITFADGSGFSPTVTAGNTNQAVGRFQLTGAASGANLTAASIKLNGTRTGMSNIKLWSSTDNSFGGDTQIGSTVASDPGIGNSASFSSFTSAIAASGGTYYFVTVDAASNATGVVQGVLVENASLTITGGTLSGTITNAALSSSDVSLPVELTDFSAEYENGRLVLRWITASETDNLGFILERRSTSGSDWVTIGDYRINDELRGQGSTTQATNYRFIDGAFIPGTEYQYRLSDVDYTGKVTVLGTREARVPPNDIPAQPLEFGLQKAYPNPFNSNIQFTYSIATDDITELTIFDINGRSVVRLVDSYLIAGTYRISWDGTGASGENIASGVYLAVLKTANKLSQQKVLLIK